MSLLAAAAFCVASALYCARYNYAGAAIFCFALAAIDLAVWTVMA